MRYWRVRRNNIFWMSCMSLRNEQFDTLNNGYVVLFFSILRARRLDSIGGGFLMVELSPISVSSVMRNPANGINELARAINRCETYSKLLLRRVFRPSWLGPRSSATLLRGPWLAVSSLPPDPGRFVLHCPKPTYLCAFGFGRLRRGQRSRCRPSRQMTFLYRCIT